MRTAHHTRLPTRNRHTVVDLVVRVSGNALQTISNQQFVWQMSYGMVLTVIDVTGRVFLHGSWACAKDWRWFTAVTENRRSVKLFQLNGRGGDGSGRLVLEIECRFVAGAASLGREFGQFGGC